MMSLSGKHGLSDGSSSTQVLQGIACYFWYIQDVSFTSLSYFFSVQLRSSFNKAFSKKGAKPSGPYADIEEIATPESSAPSSPKVHHDGDNPPSSMKSSASASSLG